MKFFRKKNARPAGSDTPVSKSDSEQSFYHQYAGEAPLDERYEGAAAHQTRRTSRHSPAHRRETSNRASNWAIFLLLFRAGLIVVLLVGGFIVLRLVLDRAAKPSEKEIAKREANVQLMEKTSIPANNFITAPLVQEVVAGPALIERRLDQWAQTEQLLRSAEALALRGIDDDAIQRLGQALRIMPENREAQQLLVTIYMRQGLYAEAVPLCIHLLDQDGLQPELQMKLLNALQASGQIASGLVLANRLLEDQPDNADLLSTAAAGQIALGNQSAALKLFERILTNNAKNKVALEGCAAIYSEAGDWQNALPYYLELVRLDPKIEYYQMLARCYAQQNEAGKAVIFMGQAASLFGVSAVSPWLREPSLDPIRETVEFRSFADRTVGAETRKAIEAINKREAEKKTDGSGGLELPQQPKLQLSPTK